MDGLKKLEQVDLSLNCIPSIGIDLFGCVNLNLLNVEFNLVKKLPRLSENLTELYLWSNDFVHITQFSIPEDLEILGIEDSKINFDPDVFQNLMLMTNK